MKTIEDIIAIRDRMKPIIDMREAAETVNNNDADKCTANEDK